MLFSSILFVFGFLPIVLLLYYAVPRRRMKIRNIILLAASLVFYSWGEPVYIVLMIYSAIFNYYMALQIEFEKYRGGSGKKNLIFTLIVNLFILGFFKYFGFLMDTLNALAGTHIHYTALALPIGISFYTFQALSYIIDVYRGRVKPQRRLLNFALYLTLFPQLIAGPIVKYRDVEQQLQNRVCTRLKFGQGAERFIWGLAKKVILANGFGELFTAVSALPHDRAAVLTGWIGLIGYTLQIYFDFSGYSDMAIGLGKMFGFEFMENFNYPYISRSITEFWRRWHISLSTWFREYLYFPLGGSRVRPARHFFNLFVVWALTGLWHGASWNFVVWGLYYCLVLTLEKYVLGKYLDKGPSWLSHLYAILIVMIGWVFFAAESMTDAAGCFRILFGLSHVPFANATTLYYLRTNLVMLIIGTAAATPVPIRKFGQLTRRYPAIGLFGIFFVFILSTAYLIYSSYNPFLYFRF